MLFFLEAKNMNLQALLEALKNMGQPNPNGVGTNYGPAYTEPGLVSVGGQLGPVGGTLGMDHGQPFGSANINGNLLAAFGPQGPDAQTPAINLQSILGLLRR